MSSLRIENIHKTYGNSDPKVLDSLYLSIPSGETTALLGRSGSGKTTLLRILAGFTDPDVGMVAMDDRVIVDTTNSLVPEKRHIGFVFQNFALFPHMNVMQNIWYGVPKKRRRSVGMRMLELVDMVGYEKRYPHELSGGQQQRIAIARALAPEPKILLLDEPFNSLDAGSKAHTLAFIKELLDKAGITTILVSHNFHEAEVLAHSCAILDSGKVLQYGLVEDVKNHPANDFVRRIIDPASLGNRNI